MLRHILENVMVKKVPGLNLRHNSEASALSCTDPSRAIQSQKNEADINTIVRQFGITGKLPTNVRVPSYGDFDTVDDFQTAMHAIKEAQASFMQMPADVRRRFDDDPGKFVDFCSDSANLEEMRKLGLAVPAPDPVPAPLGASS